MSVVLGSSPEVKMSVVLGSSLEVKMSVADSQKTCSYSLGVKMSVVSHLRAWGVHQRLKCLLFWGVHQRLKCLLFWGVH